MDIKVDNRIITPVAIPSLRAQEVSSFPYLPEPVIDAILKFEEDLFNRRDAPLTSGSLENLRLRRNRLIKRLCNLVYQTLNQAVILESDLRLTRCDLVVRHRSPSYNNPSQWDPLIDSELPEKVPSDNVISWSSIFDFFKSSLGNSFHIVFVSITDEIVGDVTHWATEFLKWCFSDGKMFLPDGTNLVFVPWFRSRDSISSQPLSQLCVRNVSNSIDTITNISIGEFVRYIVFHRFVLLKAIINEHAES